MKFALFLILFVGFVCVAQSRSNMLNELFTTQTNNVALTSCNATNSCAGKGDQCNGDYLAVGNCAINGASASNASCCASGLFCVNNTCVTDSLGDYCTSQTQCMSSSFLPMNCVNNTCSYVYGPGDSCSVNSDCITQNCNNSICQGIMIGQPCPTVGFPPQCSFGLYCATTNNNATTCQNRTASGQNCTTPKQCMEGTTCFSSSSNGTATCQTIGTQSVGGSCMDSLACASGSMCINGNCTTVNSDVVSCTLNSNCTGPNALCSCSLVTGEQYCTGSEYNMPCTDEFISLQSCLASESCSEATDAPNSCCYANCLSEYKKFSSCGCSNSDTISGGCVYNQYCGGFPVWAIIVIIVVAIVLVLAIVLLVFFMMRRRRQYDSI